MLNTVESDYLSFSIPHNRLQCKIVPLMTGHICDYGLFEFRTSKAHTQCKHEECLWYLVEFMSIDNCY